MADASPKLDVWIKCNGGRMSPELLIGLVIVLMVLVGVIVILRLRQSVLAIARPAPGKVFNIAFANGTKAIGVYSPAGTKPEYVRDQLKLTTAGPTLFIVGGAGAMSAEDVQRTQRIIDTIAEFAQENGLILIDGGTESGIMQMAGDSRRRGKYNFPLIGIAPLSKVKFPGYENLKAEGELEDSHSHFILVEGDAWGVESALIQDLARCLSGFGTYPMLGMLINGGNVALGELKMAVERRIPMIILEGSGRAADQVATAIRTGETSQIMIKQIMAEQADLQFIKTTDSPERVKQRLTQRYARR